MMFVVLVRLWHCTRGSIFHLVHCHPFELLSVRVRKLLKTLRMEKKILSKLVVLSRHKQISLSLSFVICAHSTSTIQIYGHHIIILSKSWYVIYSRRSITNIATKLLKFSIAFSVLTFSCSILWPSRSQSAFHCSINSLCETFHQCSSRNCWRSNRSCKTLTFTAQICIISVVNWNGKEIN